MDKKNITVANLANTQMPAMGLGLWKLDKDDCAAVVRNAIEIGYRHLDSAADYGNEVEVGAGILQALNDGLCKREDLWITSKLWNTYHRPQHVRDACEKTLLDLNLDYLDLYLIHFPISLKYVGIDERYPPEWLADPKADNPVMEFDPVPLADTWRAMEALVTDGLVKRIGVCNYNTGLLHDLMAYAQIKPAVLQIESHPFLSQEALLRTATHYGIDVTAFSPLAALSYVELDMATDEDSVLSQSAVVAAAKRVDRTVAQVVLRWGVQRGTAVIAKSSKSARLKENLALFDFELTDDEMKAISALNINRRFNDPSVFCEAAFNTFHAIYD